MTTSAIAPSEIQRELNHIWNSLERTGKVRASLFNLIFFTKKGEREDYIRTIIQTVIEKFPSRVILITADSSKQKGYLTARVAVETTSRGEQDIACDLIEINVAGSLEERVPFVILPHILPDLPLYVVWSEDPKRDQPLFNELKTLADRFIFDSETTTDLPHFAQGLIQLQKEEELDVSDLNWGRIGSWRDLIASTFYSQKRLERLKKATKIQILYNAYTKKFTSHTHIQSLYLQGWLAVQLGWELIQMKQKEKVATFLYKRPEGEVEVTLFGEDHPHIKGGTILSVDIETEKEDRFSLGRNLSLPHHVSMRFSTPDRCEIPLKYIFAKDQSGQSLVKEICQKGTSTHFLNLIHAISERE